MAFVPGTVFSMNRSAEIGWRSAARLMKWAEEDPLTPALSPRGEGGVRPLVEGKDNPGVPLPSGRGLE